ncbi:MAG TPA: hypothetical protein VGH29_15630, partial [Candidatus Binataceae bacterium]
MPTKVKFAKRLGEALRMDIWEAMLPVEGPSCPARTHWPGAARIHVAAAPVSAMPRLSPSFDHCCLIGHSVTLAFWCSSASLKS